jgi:hypothetical protein
MVNRHLNARDIFRLRAGLHIAGIILNTITRHRPGKLYKPWQLEQLMILKGMLHGKWCVVKLAAVCPVQANG